MYRAMRRADVAAYVRGRQAGTLGPHDWQTVDRGEPGEDWGEVAEAGLDAVLEAWTDLNDESIKSDNARDAVEGKLAAILHCELATLPASVLTDRDFWRFCSAWLYDFIEWRQSTSSTDNLLTYFGGSSESLGRDCVAHRMFDRGHIARAAAEAVDENEELYGLAEIGAADVWKSHILRVAHGNAPLVVREMLLNVRSGNLPTSDIRPFVKNLRRVRANVIFEVLDSDQARDLVDREIAWTLHEESGDDAPVADD